MGGDWVMLHSHPVTRRGTQTLHLRAGSQGQKQGEKEKARWNCRPRIDKEMISKQWPI